MTGQTRPILPGLHKSKQEDSKGERQEERVREAHREESGDLGVSWGYLRGIFGAIWEGSWGPGGWVGLGEQRIRRGLQNLLPLQKHKKGHSQPSAPVTLFIFFAAEGVALFMFFAMAEGSGHSS